MVHVPVIETVKGGNLTQLRWQQQDIAHRPQASDPNLGVAGLGLASVGEDVPPHVAGDVEGIAIMLAFAGSGTGNEAPKELSHRCDAMHPAFERYSGVDKKLPQLSR